LLFIAGTTHLLFLAGTTLLCSSITATPHLLGRRELMDWRGIYGGGMDFGAIPHMRSWNLQSHLVWTMTHTMLLLMSRLPGTGEHEPLPLPLPCDTLLSSLPSLIAVREGSFFFAKVALCRQFPQRFLHTLTTLIIYEVLLHIYHIYMLSVYGHQQKKSILNLKFLKVYEI
jgi:hypothetical protein